MSKRELGGADGTITHTFGRCPACNMSKLEKDGEGAYCPNCLYTPGPPITLEAAVAKAEAVAVAESRALRDELKRETAVAQTNRRRAA